MEKNIKKAVLSNRIYLSKTQEFHNKLMKELTYVLPGPMPQSPPEYYCDVTRVNDKVITIPISRIDLIPEDYEIEDKRILNPVIFPPFKIKLRESQQEILDDIKDNCMINANPSFGKTFTGIAIAAKLGQKTLVLVHTKFLLYQWIDEVYKTLGIEAGILGDNKQNIKPPIVIGLIQTVRKRKELVSNIFGTVIVDECHRIPSTTFKGIVDANRARYKIGLSATLWRKDGKHVYLRDYLGMHTYTPEDENRLKSKIIVVNTDFKLSDKSNVPWSVKVNELMENIDYMNLVINLARAQVQRGHKTLTVGNRVEFLQSCSYNLPNFQLISGNTSNIKPDIDNHDGILGTGQIFSEGVNIPILSSLIIAYPINNKGILKQLIGRIERPHDTAPAPEVVDIALSGRLGKSQLIGRLNYYSDEGYEIKYI